MSDNKKWVDFPPAIIKCYQCNSDMEDCKLICLACAEKNKWISIKDKLPDRSQCVMGLFKNGYIYIVFRCSWDDICDNWHYMPVTQESLYEKLDELTYWMPLPEPPND